MCSLPVSHHYRAAVFMISRQLVIGWGGGLQSAEGGAVRRTQGSSRLQTHSSCQCFRGNMLWGKDQHCQANGAAIYIYHPKFTDNPQENVRGQHSKAQGEVWELHQTGESLDLYRCIVLCVVLYVLNLKNFVLPSVTNLFLYLPPTVQQETEWEWC